MPAFHPIEHISGPQTPAGPPLAPHVLLVVDGFPKALGGGERIVLRLAQLLPGYGFRVSILTFHIHPESSVLANPPACPLYHLPLRRTYDLRAARAALALARLLRLQQVRIVHTFFESSDLWAGLVVKALSSAKLIWSRRDMGILRAPKHRLTYRLLANLPDRVFAVSDQVRHFTIATDNVPPERVQTIHNGLDLPDPTPHQPPPPFTITTVGNIRHVKGHDILIRAAATIVQRFPQTTITIAGEILEPTYAAGLETLLQTLHLTSNVRLLGSVANLPAHLRTAAIFVLPSRSEGFSNAIIEAMAASLPVVATNVGGNAEAVQHGVTGFIVPPEDPHALAHALLQLLANPAQAQTMGHAGRQRVAHHFTQQAMLQRIATAYTDLLR